MPYGTVNADVIQSSVANTSLGAGNASIMKNRIINGAMVIDQRNAGASVTPADAQYLVDRWQYSAYQASKVTAQQNAGSVTPPAGFTNYLGITSSSAYTVGSGEYFGIGQRIEGFNTADLGWGTANAKTVTLSFQVYSSLTGTFGGSLLNSGPTRSYPFSYSIPVANTWTTISITIAGDTTGTWLTNNGQGIRVFFSLGAGSTVSGTAGSWAGSGYWSTTGATSVVGTNGATFYITGVQLEVGSSATGFEYRQYGTELALCQRYFEECANTGVSQGHIASGYNQSATQARATLRYSVPKRATPTLSANGTTIYWEFTGGSATSNITPSFDNPTSRAVLVYNGSLSITSGVGNSLHEANAATTQIWVSAEL